MAIVARVGEGLARGINRRSAVKRVAAAVFGAAAALAVEGWQRNSAMAAHCTHVAANDCECKPPHGTFCGQIDSSYCSGSSCAGGCSIDETYWSAGGCWCTASCGYTGDDGSSFTGYYTCCDCDCYGSPCACREFVPSDGSEDHGGGGQPPAPPDNGPIVEPGGGFDFPPGFPFND